MTAEDTKTSTRKARDCAQVRSQDLQNIKLRNTNSVIVSKQTQLHR